MVTYALLRKRHAQGLRKAYRRRLAPVALLSVLLHFALVGALRDVHLFPEPNLQNRSIGYRGVMRLVNLAPLEDIMEKQESLALARIHSGALLTRDIELTEPDPPVRSKVTLPMDPRPPRSEREPVPETEPGPVVIELDESWSFQASSAQTPLSEQFQILKLVRPEYPSQAIQNGLQGLVVLEVDVGISGKVLGVHIRDSRADRALLERAAAKAMFNWEFRPLYQGPKAVPFSLVIPFRFRLLDG